MAKKFGKFLLFTAAVGSAAAAVYYYMRKKEAAADTPEDEDYDDFSETSEETSKNSRSYVPLTPEHKAAGAQTDSPEKDDSGEEAPKDKPFTPLSEQLSGAAENAEETVEEFFDEDDWDVETDDKAQTSDKAE